MQFTTNAGVGMNKSVQIGDGTFLVAAFTDLFRVESISIEGDDSVRVQFTSIGSKSRWDRSASICMPRSFPLLPRVGDLVRLAACEPDAQDYDTAAK